MKLSDYEMPSEKCDLIAQMLTRMAEDENHILIHEQKKVLADSDYFRRFTRTNG